MTQFDKALRYALVGTLYATLLVPFIVSDSMLFPYITGKGFAFRLLVELALALWAILAIRRPEYRPKWTSPVLAAGAVFLAVAAAADFLAVDRTVAVWSKFERMDGLALLAHVAAYALVLASTFRAVADWRRFLAAQVAAAAAMALYAATQILGFQEISQGGVRVDGRFGNAVYLAGYMLFAVGFALFLALREEERARRGVFLALAAAFAVVVAYTGTRGTLLGLAAGAAFAGALLLTFGRANPYRRVGAWAIGLIVAAVVVFAVGRQVDWVRHHPVFGRVVGVSLEDKTVLSRVWNAEIAWRGFLDRPLLGWGQGNYSLVFDRYYDTRMHDQEQYFDRTHSILTDWLVAGGALGFLAYFALLALVGWGLWRAEGLRGDERVALVALLAAYLVHNLFVFDNVASYMQYAALAGLAVALGPGREPRRLALGADLSALAAAACAVALPVVAYAVNAAPYAAARGVVAAMSESDIGRARDGFAGAIAEDSFGTPEVVYQYAQYALRVAAAPDAAVPAADRTEFVGAADAAFASATAPSAESYYRYGLGAFRLRAGNLPGAVAALEEAVALAPRKQSVRATLALAYAWAGDPRALDYARETYEIEPTDETAWRAYARVAAKVGRDDVFKALVAEAQAAGLYDRVILLAEEQAASSPQDPQARASLARALTDAGRYDDALSTIDQAVLDFPKVAAQLRAMRAAVEAARGAAPAVPAGV